MNNLVSQTKSTHAQVAHETLPRIVTFDYHAAFVGGGVATAAVIANLIVEARRYIEDPSGYLIMPRLNLTVFEPREELGFGDAFCKIHPEIDDLLQSKHNGPSNALIEGGFDRWYDTTDGSIPRVSCYPRYMLGDCHNFQLGEVHSIADQCGVPISLTHIRRRFADVDTGIDETKGSRLYVLKDDGGATHGPFHSVVIAAGGADNNSISGPADSPWYIHNPYRDYEKLRKVITSQPERIVVAGFGDTAAEVMLMLKQLQYDGSITLILQSPDRRIEDVGKGSLDLSAVEHFIYVREKYKSGKLDIVSGFVKRFEEKDGQLSVTVSTGYGKPSAIIDAPLIFTAPYRDGTNADGLAHHPVTRRFQEHGIVPIFNHKQMSLKDAFGHAAFFPHNTKDPLTKAEDIFLAGRTALNYGLASVKGCKDHAEVLGWSLLQHSIWVAWKAQSE